jgi:tetratricopeptide (TPR) repeat protein
MFLQLWERAKPLYVALFVAVLVLVVYLPHSGNQFVSLDDGLLIYKNPAVQQMTFRSFAHIFSTYDPELYVPLTLLSYQIEHALFGLNPLAFHVTNIFLHAGNVLLVFAISYLLSKKNIVIAFVCSLLFALHPLHTETVMWAAARKDLLSSFFGLLCFLYYILSRNDGDRKKRILSVIFFGLALLSKVSVILLPLSFLFADHAEGRKWDKRLLLEKIPYLLLCILFGVIAVIGKTNAIQSSSTYDTVLLAIKSASFYVQKIFFPDFFSVIYPQLTPISLSSLEFFIPTVVTLFLIALAVYLRKLFTVISHGIAFYFLMLIPNFTNFYKNGFLFFASDRYAYLASIGIFFALSCLVFLLFNRLPQNLKIVLSSAVAAVCVLLGIRATVQASTWKNSTSLYTNVIYHYPQSAMARNNLGHALKREGKAVEAEAQWKEALRLDPTLVAAHVNMGDLLKEKGNLKAAIDEYTFAIKKFETKENLNVDEVAAYYFLADALELSGDMTAAVAMYEKATQKAPQLWEPYYNLGLQYQKMGKRDEAIVAFEKTISLNSFSIDARYHLAGLYGEVGRLPEARDQLQKVVSADPGYLKASEHLHAIEAILQR